MLAGLHFEITPPDVKRRLDAGEKVRLVDVREPFEVQQAGIAGAEVIPMRTVPKVLRALEDEENPIIVFCLMGCAACRWWGGCESKGSRTA